MSKLRDWTLQYSMLWAAAQNEAIDDDCHCPEGFTSNGEECEKVTTKPTIQPPTHTPLLLIPKSFGEYSQNGTYIYDPNYILDGTGNRTLYNTNPFWKNAARNLVDGPMNRCALWTSTYTNYQQIGFSVCINIPNSKTYLFGIGVDNYMSLRVDGKYIIQRPETDAEWPFWWYHIYPVFIKKGIHVIEIIGNNALVIAAIGAEIYDATPAELMAINNVTDLDAATIFSTKNMIGQYTNLGTNGYPIDPEYALAFCFGDPPFYRKVEYADCE